MTEAWNWLRAHPRAALVALGVAIALLLAAYGAGRFASPTKVETREVVREKLVVDEKTVEARIASAKTEWERSVQDHTRVVTKYLEGKVVERVEYRDRESQASGGSTKVEIQYVDREVKVEVEKIVEKEKLVERDAPRLTLAATVGAGFSGTGLTPPVYGAGIAYRFAGPLVAVAHGEGNAFGGSARVGVGLSW